MREQETNPTGEGDYARMPGPTPPSRPTTTPMGDVRAQDIDTPDSRQQAFTVLNKPTGRKSSRKGGRSGGR